MPYYLISFILLLDGQCLTGYYSDLQEDDIGLLEGEVIDVIVTELKRTLCEWK